MRETSEGGSVCNVGRLSEGDIRDGRRQGKV